MPTPTENLTAINEQFNGFETRLEARRQTLIEQGEASLEAGRSAIAQRQNALYQEQERLSQLETALGLESEPASQIIQDYQSNFLWRSQIIELGVELSEQSLVRRGRRLLSDVEQCRSYQNYISREHANMRSRQSRLDDIESQLRDRAAYIAARSLN